MLIKKLIILDIKKDIKITRENCYFIKLSIGKLLFKNSKEILIKQLQKKYYKYFRKLLAKKLIKIVNKNQSILFNESEIVNLRNDKNNFINKIINILIINKLFIKKKSKKIELITDDYFVYKIFQKQKNIDINFYGPFKKIEYKYPILKILKFYIKSLLVVLYLNIFQKNYFINKYKHMCISIFPNFYKNNKEIFFNNSNFLKANFILTDETHNSFSLKEIYEKKFYLQKKNTFNVEQFINIRDIFINIIKAPFFYIKNFKKFNQKVVISNVDFSIYFENYLKSSFVNRLKLEIYNKALSRIFNKFSKITNFHYYMFEYSFGFFLTRFLKTNYKNIELTAYQHGIFSNNLMWLDVVFNSRMKDKYIPSKVIAYNKNCAVDYKKVLVKSNILLNKKKTISKVAQEYATISGSRISHKKILVLPGTHDIETIYFALHRKFKDQIKVIFYIKPHPKNKFKIVDTEVRFDNYDMIIIINNHPYFFDIIENKLRLNKSIYKKYIFDCWNLFNENVVTNLNWRYLNI